MHLPDRQTVAILDVPTLIHLGVSAEERARAQRITVSITATLYDPPSFADRDRLEHTLDYDALIAFVREGLPALGETRLIETVAERTAQHALALSPRIAMVEVTVEKPAVLNGAGAARVSLLRHGDRATHRHALFLAGEAARDSPG